MNHELHTKRAFLIIALLVALAAVAGWLALGANRGWTRTTVPVKTLDEVTGIEGIGYRKQFVPGVELLGLALVVSASLAGGSFLFRNQQDNRQTQQH